MGLLFESLSADIVVGVFTLLLFVYLGYFYSYGYWKRKGIPYIPPPTSIFGNVSDFILSKKPPGTVMMELYHKLEGKPYGGIFMITSPALLVRDPEIIKQVFVKDFDHFVDRSINIHEKINPLEGNLFMLKGERWRWLRTKLTPTFTSGKIKMMFQVLSDCASEMNAYVSPTANSQDSLEIRELIAKYTTDIIGTCAFGLQFNALKNPDSEFRAMGRKIFQVSTTRKAQMLLVKVLPFLAEILNISIFDLEASNFFLNAVNDTVEHREKNNISRSDFLQLLIQLKNKGHLAEDRTSGKEDAHLYYKIGNGESRNNQKFVKYGTIYKNHNLLFTELNDGLLAAQCFVFFLAGFETSSTTVSFCLYELATNPEIQERLREEVDTVLQKYKGTITYEAIQEMDYLSRVVDGELTSI
uniref:Cytochrome P450 n=1 Tax=Timema tahoe TaxID=61484 RepID=A0A7R9P1Y3_9NEOP|nr:unnamed protein product [Timema tahoe]